MCCQMKALNLETSGLLNEASYRMKVLSLEMGVLSNVGVELENERITE